MRQIRIGKPTITQASKELVIKALEEGRVSEGQITNELEKTIASFFGVQDAIAVNSGHSALVIALKAARLYRDFDEVVTTPITFISTIAAAIEAGMKINLVDTKHNSFLLNESQASEILDERKRALYLPVHLFGYEVDADIGRFTIQDACEALGTKDYDGNYIGIEDIGCFSFYTSHVLGCGEMGMVLTNNSALAILMRKLKDQGRKHIRPSEHIEVMTKISPFERYSHDLIGWNFRTTDLQAALILGSFKEMTPIIRKRYWNIIKLNTILKKYNALLTLPNADPNVSYLAYPIICKDEELKNKLMLSLDTLGIETRPLMSLIPEERAMLGHKLNIPFGYSNAKEIHEQSFYISCHDTLNDDDMDYISECFKKIMGW